MWAAELLLLLVGWGPCADTYTAVYVGSRRDAHTAGSAFQVIHVEGGKYPVIMAEEIKIICYFF